MLWKFIHTSQTDGPPISLKRFLLMVASTYRGLQNMLHLLKEKNTWGGIPDAVTL